MSEEIISKKPKESGFWFWLTNIFLYHYKIHIAVFVFLCFASLFLLMNYCTRRQPDFRFAIVSGETVYTWQIELIEEFFEAHGIDAAGTAFISTVGVVNNFVHRNINLALINPEYTLFVVGESMLHIFEEHRQIFYPVRILGFEPSAVGSVFVDISYVDMTYVLQLTGEPLYAMIKLTPGRDAYAADRTRLTVEFLKIFIGFERVD
ncbi:MAG: hypothetical protein FWC95_05315 [Defluviitaleaceae bacterium]|nr:hypothetical protein [Defluviitaleaceae bacterium]